MACVRAQGHDALEVLGLVLVVGDGPAVAVEVARAGPPPRRVEHAHDAVDAVGGEETVGDALAQAVLVERLAEVDVGVAALLVERRRRQAELGRAVEMVQDRAPPALVAGAAPVGLVHDHEVEEVGRVGAVEAGAGRVLGQGLVGGEVHLAALVGHAALDLPAGVAEGQEGLVLGVVHQHIAVGQVQDARLLTGPRAAPARAPELPADLEGDLRLARAGSQREQHAAIALHDGPHRSVDGDLLVVARSFPRVVVRGREHTRGLVVREPLRPA